MTYKQPYQEKYPHLFSPITIRGKVFKNRIIMGPHGRMNNSVVSGGDGMGILSVEGAEYYGGFARGGAAAVNIFGFTVDPYRGSAHGAFNIINDGTLPTLNLFADHVHSYSALASAELYHCGLYSLPQLNGGHNALGPSARIAPQGYPVDEMTEADMEHAADMFAQAAHMCKRASFDMLLIHGGHSWLLSQFLSPTENRRTDKYGGSLENRARFPMMVLDRIRERIGNDLLIEYRISADELTEGGLTVDEAVQFIKMIEDRIDIVQCSAGLRANAFTRGIMHPSHFMKNGCNAYLAKAMKDGGVTIPVTAIGAINDPAVAEQILADGWADFVCMVRSFIADPYWAEKARECREEDIVPCIKCLRCLDVGGGRKATNTDVISDDFDDSTRRAECSVNPTSGRAHFMFRYPEPRRSKKVVVVGGGPAGLRAAARAAERGHRVVLFEKSDRLGGQLRYADQVCFKQDMKRFMEHLICQVEKRDIRVLLNTEATPELVHLEAPDAVIVAVGAEPVIPPIPGVDGPNVMAAVDVYGNEARVGDHPLIIGGGFVGCETALHLAQLGKKPTIVEMGDLLIADGILTERMHTIYYLTHEYDPENAQYNRARELPDKVRVHMQTRCTGIQADGVTVVGPDGVEQKIAADTVILAAGMRAKTEVYERFIGVAHDVINVGDSKKASTVYNAITTGFDAGTVIL